MGLLLAAAGASAQVAGPATAAASVTVRLGQVSFRIPKAYLQGEMPRDGTQRVTLVVLIPGLEAKSAHNARQFALTGADRAVLSFTLRRDQRYRFPTPRAQLDDYLVSGWLEASPQAAPHGLVRHVIAAADAKEHQRRQDYLFGSYGAEHSVLLVCGREEARVTPQCHASLYLGNEVALDYAFGLSQLRHWQTIDEGLRRLAASFRQ
jgi:hypothetical protein